MSLCLCSRVQQSAGCRVLPELMNGSPGITKANEHAGLPSPFAQHVHYTDPRMMMLAFEHWGLGRVLLPSFKGRAMAFNALNSGTQRVWVS